MNRHLWPEGSKNLRKFLFNRSIYAFMFWIILAVLSLCCRFLKQKLATVREINGTSINHVSFMVEKPSSKFYYRLALRFPQCLPFRPKLPLSTLIVELVSRYRLSLARSRRRKRKTKRTRQIVATPTWQLLQEVVIASHSRCRYCSVNSWCMSRVTSMRRHRKLGHRHLRQTIIIIGLVKKKR